MSLLLRYKFNGSTADLVTDSSGNSNHLVDNTTGRFVVQTVIDPTYGNVLQIRANSTADVTLPNPPTEMTGSHPRTFSYWIKKDNVARYDLVHGNTGGDDYYAYWQAATIYRIGGVIVRPPNPLVSDQWYHSVITYDGAMESFYLDGALIGTNTRVLNTGVGAFKIGDAYTLRGQFNGYLSDFRVYDDALSAGDVSTLFSDGPNPPTPFIVTPRAASALVTFDPVGGATGYRITLQKTGSTRELVVKTGFIDLTQTIKNLTPETEYTFRLYSTTGNTYDLAYESTVSTLENSASNYNTSDYLSTSGSFDLGSLDTTSVELLSDVMNELFTTGDAIDIVVPGGRGTTTKSKFVNRGANVGISDSESIVAPFSTDAGSGQSVTLTLSDSSDVTLSYNETTEAVTVGGTEYASGDSFVLDGKKATIIDI